MDTLNSFSQQPRNYFNTSRFPTSNMGTSTNNIVWVQGIEGAKAWQLHPNSMVILLDSEVEGKMYIKVSDNIGMSSLRVFNCVEEIPNNGNPHTHHTETINNLDLSQYVRKDELNQILKELLDEQTVSTTAADPATDDKPAGKYKVTSISKK